MKAWLVGDRVEQERHFQRLLEMEREYQALPPRKKFIAKWSAFLIPLWVGGLLLATGACRRDAPSQSSDRVPSVAACLEAIDVVEVGGYSLALSDQSIVELSEQIAAIDAPGMTLVQDSIVQGLLAGRSYERAVNDAHREAMQRADELKDAHPDLYELSRLYDIAIGAAARIRNELEAGRKTLAECVNR